MTDIVERLDILYNNEMQWENVWEIAEDASAEITRLRAENEKLRAALKPFVDRYAYTQKYCPDREHMPIGLEDLRAAAAALKESGDE